MIPSWLTWSSLTPRPGRRRRGHLRERAPRNPQLVGHQPGRGDDRHQLPRQADQQTDLGELDPRDDDGFARVLGPWTRQVPFWPGSQAGPVPGTP